MPTHVEVWAHNTREVWAQLSGSVMLPWLSKKNRLLVQMLFTSLIFNSACCMFKMPSPISLILHGGSHSSMSSQQLNEKKMNKSLKPLYQRIEATPVWHPCMIKAAQGYGALMLLSFTKVVKTLSNCEGIWRPSPRWGEFKAAHTSTTELHEHRSTNQQTLSQFNLRSLSLQTQVLTVR